VSEKVQAAIAAENGKPAAPAKPGTPPVIRRVVVAEENAHERLMKRQVPAWTISGGIHVAIMGIFILLPWDSEIKANIDDKIVTTTVEEQPEKKEDLTNPDLGFDADLKAATDSEREEIENVDAPTTPDEPIGAINEQQDQPTQTFSPPGFGDPLQEAGAIGDRMDTGLINPGLGGGGSQFSAPGMRGRSGATKDKLLAAGGGNAASEAAVALGLQWLAAQQKQDGRWQFDGGSKDDIAATGLGLLPFLAAGETHKQAKKYQKTVMGGITFLTSTQLASGTFRGSSGLYAHGIATIALCEAYAMTLDPSLKAKAQAAIDYIVKAQAGNGSWGYSAGAAGDTSIVGWQIQALKSGMLGGLKVPPDTMKKAGQFLDDVSTDSGARYGYTTRGGSPTLSAVGLLSRQYMGWTPKNPSLAKGVEYLMTMQPSEANFEMYYLYYATQVVHFFEGPEWHQKWNPKIRDMLVKKQVKTAGPNKGSWDADGGHIGGSCGRLGTTALCLLTLEVYYRHLPLYKRDSGGAGELER
jgi:hypothetical protein